MITESIITVVFSFFTVLINFFPSITLPAELASSLVQAFSWVSWANYYIPLDIFFVCFGIVVSSWVPIALVKIFLDLF